MSAFFEACRSRYEVEDGFLGVHLGETLVLESSRKSATSPRGLYLDCGLESAAPYCRIAITLG